MRFFVIGLLFACAGALNAQDRTGTIVFYREPHFAGSNSKPPTILCDGMELARLANGTYFEVTAIPGSHTCEVDSSRDKTIEVNAVAGSAAYVHVEMLSGFSRRFALTNTTEEEYDKQKAKLKPVKEWSRNSLGPAVPVQSVHATTTPESHPVSSASAADSSHYSARFGALIFHVTKLANLGAAPQAGRHRISVLLSATNQGTEALCAHFDATLDGTFDLHYPVATGQPPNVDQMLPGESSQGSYVFYVKDGVEPLELALALESSGVRCSRLGSEPGLPRQVRIDIHDLGGTP